MTMIMIEIELLEKIGRLDAAKQRQVLAYVESLLPEDDSHPPLTLAEWSKLADESLEEFRAKYGKDFTVDIQPILDEIREEPTDERLGRR